MVIYKDIITQIQNKYHIKNITASL